MTEAEQARMAQIGEFADRRADRGSLPDKPQHFGVYAIAERVAAMQPEELSALTAQQRAEIVKAAMVRIQIEEKNAKRSPPVLSSLAALNARYMLDYATWRTIPNSETQLKAMAGHLMDAPFKTASALGRQDVTAQMSASRQLFSSLLQEMFPTPAEGTSKA